MTPFTIINKKKQAINLHPKYFLSYDTFYKNKQKGTTNKFAPENYFFHLFVIPRHTVNHIITLCIPKNYYKKIFTFLFFTVYKNEWKECKF